jgi:hypothetical protein
MKTPKPKITPKQNLPSNQEHQDITWFHKAKSTRCMSTGRRTIISTRETRDYKFEKRSLNGFIIHPTQFLSPHKTLNLEFQSLKYLIKKAKKPLSNPYVETLEEDLPFEKIIRRFYL